jgi:chloramphenicol-sensitive protein RarD
MTAADSSTDTARQTFAGLIAALIAFVSWGLTPIFFKQLADLGAIEIISHRVIWTVILLAILFQVRGLWPKVRQECASRRKLLAYCVTTTLIALNWGTYIWAVSNSHIVEASLGYYINPLVVVALAMIVLGERLRPWQGVSVVFALMGVGYMVWRVGYVPIVALTLALSFSTYAIIRKKEGMDPFVGLFVETALLVPLALAYIGWLTLNGEGAFITHGLPTHLLLVMAGVVTAVPLICYMQGAKFLAMKTMGLLSYLSPSLQLLIGTAVYGEPFGLDTAITFGLIWLGLLVYTVDAFRARKRLALAVAQPAAGGR